MSAPPPRAFTALEFLRVRLPLGAPIAAAAYHTVCLNYFQLPARPATAFRGEAKRIRWRARAQGAGGVRTVTVRARIDNFMLQQTRSVLLF